jgi:hypothetical protein
LEKAIEQFIRREKVKQHGLVQESGEVWIKYDG